ncbi:ribonuclease H-like protein [Mycena leptocephala]|nr:ribonuclease H-like protein [Mycena leptocephala]
MAPPEAQQAPGERIINAAISGYVTRRGLADAQGGAGIWYSANDPRNASLRIPPSLSQTQLNAEIVATLHCVQSSPPDVPLRITIRGDAITAVVNRNLGKWEDRGWIGVPDKAPIQALAACLRKRKATTIFTKLQNTESSASYTMASQLAKDGSAAAAPSDINVTIAHQLQLRGAKLSTLTQALAYKGIKELRALPARKTTETNVKLIQDAIKSQCGKTPTPASIWRSVRHKDISRQIKTFFWKAIHGAHRVGKFWTHIPGYEERAMCRFCEEAESLEHILLKCRCPGQAQVWKLVDEMWTMKHGPLPPPSMGEILGCCLASFEPESKAKPSGVNRLYRILISESAYLIWKIRCERVIGRDGEFHSESEIHNRWVHTLNDRLEIDRFMACDYTLQSKKLVPPSLVVHTWNRTLLSEDKLPKDWLTATPKVLVGIVPRRSQRSSSPDPGG